MDEARIVRLERRVDELSGRVAVLETPVGAPPPDPAAIQPAPTTPPTPEWSSPPVRDVARKQHEISVEDLLGGRVLAWVGGIAVLLGLVFLFAVAVSNGWIGEGSRVALGAIASSGLLALGVWLHERRARTDAALASVATGIAGLFLTITVATQVYEVVPSLPGTFFAVLVGGVATALAVGWESRGVAALGILGAVGAPVLAGASGDAGSIAIELVALSAAAGVLVWQRWSWLGLGAFVLAAPQWISYLFLDASLAQAMATLIAFGLVGVVMAVGHDLRLGAARLRLQGAFLLALNAIAVGCAGWFALDHLGEPDLGKLWLAALAVVHVAIGLSGRRLRRVSDELGLLSVVLGVLFADVTFALVADGAALAIGWSLTSVGLAAVLRRVPGGRDETVAGLGLGGHLALALTSTLAVDDPFSVLAGDGVLSAASAASVGALAAGCLVSGQLAAERSAEWRVVLDVVGLAAVATLTALSLDGQALVLAWVGEAVVLTAIARARRDAVAAYGAGGFLVLAALHALVYEAPPVSLVTGLAEPIAAVATLGAVAAAALAAAGRLPGLRAAAAVTMLYLGSALVVTPFESGNAMDSALVSAHQQGQMVLSVFWAMVGVGTLVLGLGRDSQALRLAALTLLGVTAGKVFLFDLATLTSMYRVVSLIALGLLLLAGAYFWQRRRPRALPDLRGTPDGLR